MIKFGVKLIWAFWIIVAIGIVIAAVIVYWWLLIPAVIMLAVAAASIYSSCKTKKKPKEKEQGISYIKSKKKFISKLTAACYEETGNFIESCPENYFSLNDFQNKSVGYELFNKNSLCASYLEMDGFPTVAFFNRVLEKDKKSYDKFSVFIKGLKKQISPEWSDADTLDAVVYLVFRNNLIKYFYNQYIEQFNCETIKDLCSKCGKGNVDGSMFTYYFIYKNNINQPIVPMYNSICSKIQTEFENI